jgi:GntR family transcriptional regulator
MNHVIRVDLRSDTPIYLQIVEQIRRQLQSGELKKGDQLPTVRQLAADLRINFNTVARAYRILDEAGLISTQHGRGTYIWETLTDESEETLQGTRLKNLARDFLETALADGHSAAEIRAVINEITEKKSLNQEKELREE